MMRLGSITGSAGALMVALTCAATPAHAQQSVADLDAIVDASTAPDQASALAQRQQAEGDLLGAAATLERALLRGSAQATAGVRLHYIGLLCKLGDRPRALAELTRLKGARTADDDWAATQAACGALPRPAAGGDGDTRFAGQVAAGIAYDSDTLGALAVQFALPGVTGVRDDGVSFVASADLAGRVPAPGGFVYGRVAAVSKTNLSGPPLDYQIGDFQLGYGGTAGRIEHSGGFFGRYGRIAGRDFVGEYGGEARIALALSPRSRIALNGVVVHQRYVGSSALFSRDGERYDLALDLQGRLSGGASYVAGAAFEYKTADTAYLGYTGGRVFGAARVPIGVGGSYGGVSATIRHVAYRAPPFGGRQIETRYFARAALGTPLIAGLDVEAAGSYTRRDYNAASFLADYSSVGGEVRLVWNFGQ